MTLNKLPRHCVKVAPATATAIATETELAFSSDSAPSAKLTLNINAFNGNKTNFGGNRNGNK
jgi:hypothetical protein